MKKTAFVNLIVGTIGGLRLTLIPMCLGLK